MTVPTGYALDDGTLIDTWPRVLWQIAFNAGGNSTDPNHWYTVTKRLRGTWSAALSGRQYELDAAQAGTASFQLDSLDGTFDPDNTSSDFYPHVVPYRRLRLVVMTDPSQNLLYPWVAAGYSTVSMAATDGTLATIGGLPASPSGLTNSQTWTLPSGSAAGARFGLSGEAASWSDHDGEGTTATPGAPYSLGIDVQLAPGGDTSLPLQAQIGWYDLTGTFLARTTGTTTATSTAWTRLTAAGTAPTSAAFAVASLGLAGATTAQTVVRATGWQLEQATTPTAWTGPGAWHQLWQGFVESFTQRYDQNGKYALTDVTGVDSLGPLSQLTLGPVMPDSLALTTPQWWFDLANPVGTEFADNGGSSAVLDIVGAAITTGASITSTTTAGTLWNVPGPVVTLTNDQAATGGNTSGGTYLQPVADIGQVLLPSAGGWSRMICFRTTHLPGSSGSYSLATLWAATNDGFLAGSGTAQDGAYLFINADGHVALNVQKSDGTSLVATNPAVGVCDGDWHCAIASLSPDGTTATVTIDDTIWHNSAATDQHGIYTRDAIGTLLVGSSINTQPFNGDLAYFAQWASELDGPTRDALARGFARGWSGDSIAGRIDNILTVAGFHPGSGITYRFIGSVGNLGSTTTNGQSPLQLIQTAADTENGQFVIDHNGTPTLYGHTWRWKQSTPRLTFGEDTAGGEIPYNADITFATDPAHLYSDVQITCSGAADATDTNQVQTASDATSQDTYFPQTLSRTINPQTVADGKNIADYLISQYKDPHTRVGQITVDLAHSPALQAQLAGLAFSDLVRVMRRPTLAPAKTLDGFIEQLAFSGDDTGQVLQARLQISPASQYRYWMYSAAWATLAADAAAGADRITIGPVSGDADIPAQYILAAGQQLVVGYGTAAAETITVASVTTVAPGYTTATVTLTGTLTAAHTAGETACEPLPSNVTLPPDPATYPTCFDGSAAFDATLFGF